MTTQKIEIQVPEEYHLDRIDIFLTHSLELDLSRSFIQRLIKNGNITVNGKTIKQNYKIKLDDIISIEIPEPEELKITPQDIPIEIIYEDCFIAIINKPPGLVVHPGSGNWDKTLVNALLYHLKDLSSIGGTVRPGIVHRLDKDTSGLMIIAKNDAAHKFLTDEFANRNIKKIYNAIVIGKPNKAHDIIDMPIGRHPKYRHKMTIMEDGKSAITEFTIKKIWNTRLGLFTHLEILLHTGRTHQIRVHLSSIGNPIVGDPIYSKKWEKYRVPYLLLASTSIEFTHPNSGKKMHFTINLPEHIADYIQKLENLVIS